MKLKLQTVLVMSIVALCSVACSDREKPKPTAYISGSYEGYILANSAHFKKKCTANETIVISENADGTAKITFSSDSWGKFTVTNAQKSQNSGACSLKGSGQTQMGRGGNTSTYDCTFSATLNSKDNAQMQFTIPSVMGGLTLDFKTGEAPADLLLAGTYKGYTQANCQYFQDKYTDNESLKITANGDGTISIKFVSETWGTFEVANSTITKNKEGYTFTGSGSVAMGMSEKKNNYDFTMTGTTNAKKDTYSFAFHVPAVMGGLTITLVPGSAPSSTK